MVGGPIEEVSGDAVRSLTTGAALGILYAYCFMGMLIVFGLGGRWDIVLAVGGAIAPWVIGMAAWMFQKRLPRTIVWPIVWASVTMGLATIGTLTGGEPL